MPLDRSKAEMVRRHIRERLDELRLRLAKSEGAAERGFVPAEKKNGLKKD
jgi:hypothetical protein